MELMLKRPLAFLDIETTGTDIIKDRIVEISVLKVYPSGDKEQRTYRINPGMPIPLEVVKIHGISDKDVEDKPYFKDIANELMEFLSDCDFAGYNSNDFDIPLLVEEFMRAGVNFDFSNKHFIDVKVIFHKMEPRTLSAAYKFYCGKELDNAHSASADTQATYEILKAQLDKYNKLKNDVKYLKQLSIYRNNVDFAGRIVYNKDRVPVFNFGKYKGRSVLEVLKKHPEYYHWIMKSKFPLYTKKLIKEIKEAIK